MSNEKGKQVKVKGHTCRLTGETKKGKSGKLFVALQVGKFAVVPFGKRAKLIGWNAPQWVREELIEE